MSMLKGVISKLLKCCRSGRVWLEMVRDVIPRIWFKKIKVTIYITKSVPSLVHPKKFFSKYACCGEILASVTPKKSPK